MMPSVYFNLMVLLAGPCVRAHTNLMLRESLDDYVHRHLLPRDIECVIDEPVDEPGKEPEV